jgi:hypothetical protein
MKGKGNAATLHIAGVSWSSRYIALPDRRKEFVMAATDGGAGGATGPAGNRGPDGDGAGRGPGHHGQRGRNGPRASAGGRAATGLLTGAGRGAAGAGTRSPGS